MPTPRNQRWSMDFASDALWTGRALTLPVPRRPRHPLIPVLVPIILPTLLTYGIDLTHFGVLMVIAVVIGQVTPPVAIALVITGRLAEVDQLRVFWANLPFLWGILIFTLVVIGFPQIATWLPSLMQD